MSAFSLDANLIDWILALVAAEALLIMGLRFYFGRGPKLISFLCTLVAGTCLLIGVRFALANPSSPWIGLWLSMSGLAHLADLSLRWQDDNTSLHPKSAQPESAGSHALRRLNPFLSPLPLKPQDEASNG